MIGCNSQSRMLPMLPRILTGFLLLAVSAGALAQSPVRLKSAVVVLSDDQALRQEIEHAVVAEALEHDYDAVPSHEIAPDADDLDGRAFLNKLADRGIRAVLMLRPAAVGEGASLELVRNEVSPEMFEAMRKFAGEVSTMGSDELIAVVHLAIYALDGNDATMLSSGAVWLDEDVSTREEGIARLLELIAMNIDNVRPAIRRHLGMPPLP
jgi:hypothetical protein